jgi:RNA polymerase sigma-70 factor (ECF subfamily)
MTNDSSDTPHPMERLRGGSRQAPTGLSQRHRGCLRRPVEPRMDARLRGRGDASEVLQDAWLDAACRLNGDHLGSEAPSFLGLRLVVGERLSIGHRRHLGTRMRGAGLEVPRSRDPLPRPPQPPGVTTVVTRILEFTVAMAGMGT